MADLNSKIEAARDEVSGLQQQIEQAQKGKKDQALAAAAAGQGPLSGLRGPPTTRCRRTLKGHFGKVTAIHWGGDSRTLVSASQDGNLLIWNAVSCNKLQSIALKSSYVMAVGIEQSAGNMVACGGLDNLCTVYRRSKPDQAMEMASHDGFLSCCRFLSEEKIVTSSGDSTCILWDIQAAKPVSTFAEHSADAMDLALKPGDKNVFVSGSVDQTSKVWDVRAPQNSVQTFRGHTADINGIEFLPSTGNTFASCSQDNTVRIFDLRAYNELARFGEVNAGGAGGPPADADAPTEGLTCLAVSKSGRLIFCGHSDGNVLAFDTLSDKATPAFIYQAAHEKHVSCVGVSPHGDALCTASWDSLLKIWA